MLPITEEQVKAIKDAVKHLNPRGTIRYVNLGYAYACYASSIDVILGLDMSIRSYRAKPYTEPKRSNIGALYDYKMKQWG